MTAYYKRTISADGAKDSTYKLKSLERASVALASESYAASATVETTLPAAMGSALTLNLGTVATSAVVYVEYTGTSLTIALTDGNGVSTLSLNSTVEKVFLLEGVAVTQIDVQNTHGSTEAPLFVAVFGAI